MKVELFKDQLFNLQIDSNSMGISNNETDYNNNTFTVETLPEYYGAVTSQIQQATPEQQGHRCRIIH